MVKSTTRSRRSSAGFRRASQWATTGMMREGRNSPSAESSGAPSGVVLPAMRGRWPSGRAYSSSFICRSTTGAFSSITRMSCSPRANSTMRVGSSGHTRPTL